MQTYSLERRKHKKIFHCYSNKENQRYYILIARKITTAKNKK